jgi:hypothetical protein
MSEEKIEEGQQEQPFCFCCTMSTLDTSKWERTTHKYDFCLNCQKKNNDLMKFIRPETHGRYEEQQKFLQKLRQRYPNDYEEFIQWYSVHHFKGKEQGSETHYCAVCKKQSDETIVESKHDMCDTCKQSDKRWDYNDMSAATVKSRNAKLRSLGMDTNEIRRFNERQKRQTLGSTKSECIGCKYYGRTPVVFPSAHRQFCEPCANEDGGMMRMIVLDPNHPIYHKQMATLKLMFNKENEFDTFCKNTADNRKTIEEETAVRTETTHPCAGCIFHERKAPTLLSEIHSLCFLCLAADKGLLRQASHVSSNIQQREERLNQIFHDASLMRDHMEREAIRQAYEKEFFQQLNQI